MKTITADDVITWLKGLTPDTIVYHGADVNRCVVACYAMVELGVVDPEMGNSVWEKGGFGPPVAETDLDLVALIDRWDGEAGEDGLTAAQALAVVEAA